ncbi:hypothetical protein KV557_24390 [Kitasatospora aureofaciens]|uniref:hypothetical protein n=1 Tax=Kitasatospora aureofaciens TaxID=1894 RepID=UPI001C443A6C|nr:hypothetical protein [Kitasatospora aureofaciens]MBV6700205.1 hypothetical protein [Kitasatospora aureofaciens]
MSIVRTVVRTPLAAGAAVVAAVLLTGCSSGSGPVYGAPGGVAASAAATAGSSASPSAGLAVTPTLGASGAPAFDTPVFGSPSRTPSGPPIPTGAFLRGLLPAAATVPAGWTIDGDGGESDTGTSVLEEPSDPLLPKATCTEMRLAGTILSQDLQASGAGNEVYDGKNKVDIRLAAYHAGDAAKVLNEIRAYGERCKSFTGRSWGGDPVPETVTVQPVPGLGDEAIDMKMVPQGPYDTDEIIVIRLGDRLLSLWGNNIVERLPNFMQLAVPLSKSAR